MKENLLVLEVQISSASGELQKLKAEQDELTPLAAIRGRRRICNRCHQSGHTKTTCKSRPCESSNNCKIREKHPEMKAKISSLQAELKELQKQHKNRTLRCRQRKIKIEVFFIIIMRNRLRLQNLPKYSDRLKLDKDLLVLQRALRNEAQKWDPEEGDWQLLITIEKFHHCKVSPYLAVKRFVALAIKVIPQYFIAHPYCARFLRHSRAQMSACTYTTKEISLKLSSIAK